MIENQFLGTLIMFELHHLSIKLVLQIVLKLHLHSYQQIINFIKESLPLILFLFFKKKII